MKKIISIIVILILALCLSSCDLFAGLLEPSDTSSNTDSSVGTDTSTDTSTSTDSSTDTSTDTSVDSSTDTTDTSTDENGEHEHIIEIIPAVEPTCTKIGLTEGQRCKICKKTLVSPKIVPASHKEEIIKGYEETCTQDGLSDGKKCTVCNTVLVEQEIIPAGHDEYIIEGTPADCYNAGLTQGKGCKRCNTILVKQEIAPKTEHNEVIVEAVAPTCEKTGLTQGKKCSICGDVFVEQQEIAIVPHTEVVLKYRAPTCAKEGLTEGKYCSVCSIIIVEQAVIPKTGHTEKTLNAVAPTCSSTGLTQGKECSVCKEKLVPQIVLSKLSHSIVIEQAVKPTCQNDGSTEGRYCSICKEVILKKMPILKTGHTEVILEAIPATCSTKGLTEGKKCLVCDEIMVAQKEIPISGTHVYGSTFDSVTTQPTFSSSGKGVLKCEKCNATTTATIDKYTTGTISKNDVYSVTTNNEYNPAIDNLWKVFDGNKKSAGYYSPGSDWFGNVGDKLIITLKQEMILTHLYLYTTGNHTYGKVTVKDSAGNVTKEKTILASAENQTQKVFENSQVKAYTIEIEVTELKWNGNPYTFKVAEVELMGAKPDKRLPHTHVYRDYIKTSKEATCLATGTDVYSCFCGQQTQITSPKKEHSYDILSAVREASCNINGSITYSCECGKTKQTTLEAKGHVYQKLVSYIKQPTKSSGGEVILRCLGCEQTQTAEMLPLPLEEIFYLRVEKIEKGVVTLKFNIYEEASSYEIRFSSNEITADNFSSATKINATVSGEREITLRINLDASLSNCFYVAVRPYQGSNYGEIATVRVGGDKQVLIDYHSANVYHGEVLNSFANLFDEQTSIAPSTKLGTIFNDKNDTILYGMNMSPIIDLEYMHYITKVSLYFDTADYSIKVRWSDTPLDFMSSDSLWDGFYVFNSKTGWNDITVNKNTRYIQVIFKDGQSPCEITAYGYQCGSGDTISQSLPSLPTVGEMIGMCGFAAIGEGYTPVDSVNCTTVLREYHNFGWSYNDQNYPGKTMKFTNGTMGNFDESYKKFYDAGINVIPCFQWHLTNTYSVSHKVDENKNPIYNNGTIVMTSFFEKFDPHTYFTYANGMFLFSARYGSNKSNALINIMEPHVSEQKQVVGLGYIKWIELGNEPEGSWNGVHNYYSAYQLAALTSAGYDGHGSTLKSQNSAGYPFGAKNADPNMKVAMAGVSGISNEYITALCYWMKANRADGKVAFDAFNVHHYMSKQVEIEGNKLYVGMSPEEAKLVETLSQLIEIRNKYYTDKEVWITEFGWDTNQSYATVNSSHAYGEYTGRQVQAMWLTRAYLLLSASGINKATMYMCEDTGIEAESVGKFGTSGVIAYEYDANGNKIEVKKDSYYYLYTLKNTLGDYTFSREIEAYDENVMIYEYKNASGDTTYAVWCKTSDGTKSQDYQLKIDGSSATLVEAVYGDIDGVSSELIADSLGYVTVDVSENPVYVVVK